MRKVFTVVFMLVLAGSIGYLSYTLSKPDDLAADDSSALFGGVSEFGYPSAGYVVTETNQGVKTCGFSVISSTQAITAAHCVDDATDMYLGKGQYQNDRRLDTQVSKAIQKEGWVKNDKRTDDIALLYYDDPDYFDSFSEIASPEEGCNLRVVAYGRTEDPNDPPMLRKSAQLCAYDIESKIFKIKGTGDSGICFGDSGSPVYIESTNQLVGVIASIVNAIPNDPNPCAFDNTAIVVRVDNNIASLRNEPVNGSTSATDENIPKEFTIEVTNETFLQSLGLDRFENMEKREKFQYLLYTSIAMFAFLAALLVYSLIKEISLKKSASKIDEKTGLLE